MHVEKKLLPVPPPPYDVVITLSSNEARALTLFIGCQERSGAMVIHPQHLYVIGEDMTRLKEAIEKALR